MIDSLKSGKWDKPKSKSVGLFTDLTLFYDALKLCRNLGVINLNVLRKAISERLIGLRYIEQLKKRAFTDLIRELNEFSWIQPKGIKNKEETFYEITNKGLEIIEIYERSRKAYFRQLCIKMQETYTVPAWFAYRLWLINPVGQGQVVIPAPLKAWNPGSYEKSNYSWNKELESQTGLSYTKINTLIPGSLPIEKSTFIKDVQTEYERLGDLKKRIQSVTHVVRDQFSPRRRLSMAMRTASIMRLFGNSYGDVSDFSFKTPLIKERTFMAWCPRLESLELIFYSDYYRDLPGRLIFPISTFKEGSNTVSEFIPASNIKSPDGRILNFHQPKWESFKDVFLTSLFSVYQNLHNKERILYVPIQDVRDEVCRLLRISSGIFDLFLEEGFKSALLLNTSFAIALETDVRNDQTSGYQVARRPVYVQGVPHSLIALKPNN